MNRRELLAAAGAGLVATPLAGCSDVFGSSEGQAPYAQYVSAELVETVEEFRVASVDIEAHYERLDDYEDDGVDTLLGGIGDPIRSWWVGHGFLAHFGTNRFEDTGLEFAMEEDGGANAYHAFDGALVVEGSFDPDELATALEEATASGDSLDEDSESGGFEEADEYEGYRTYESSAAETVVAFDDDHIVTAWGGFAGQEDPNIEEITTNVRHFVDAIEGDGTPLVEEDDGFEALAAAYPDVDYGTVRYAPDGWEVDDETQLDDAFEGMTGYAMEYVPADGDVGDEVVLEAAIRFTDEDAVPDSEVLVDTLAGEATATETDVDGATVTLEATYEMVLE